MCKQLEHHYALLIGVGKCDDPKWSLPVTVNNVKALKEVLVNHCGYIDDEEHIRLVCNEEATKRGILESLKWLKEKSDSDSEATVFVYYSGHGLLNQYDEYFLVPHDFNKNYLLTAYKFNQSLKQIKTKKLLVIIDSCHAQRILNVQTDFEGWIKTAFPEKLIQELKQGGRRAIFTSSTNNEKSYVVDDNSISIYTYHLLEALQGAGSNSQKQEVSVYDLSDYLDRVVPKSVSEYQEEQNPHSEISGGSFNIGLLRGGEGLPPGGWNSIKQEVKQNIDDIIKRIQQTPQENNADKIVQALKEGYFCHVLTYPIKEKNKLLEYIKINLNEEQIPFTVINPLKIDGRRRSQNFQWETRDSWYQKLVDIINQDFALEISAGDYWTENNNEDKNRNLSLLRSYIEKVLFRKRKKSTLVIIFDLVITSQQTYQEEYWYLFDGLKFRNEVYYFIRNCYEMRKRYKDYQRLNFIVLDTLTRFNYIGKDIKKSPFTLAWKVDIGSDSEVEERPIINYGLDEYISQVNVNAVIERIWYWTCGNPFLTQTLLHKVIFDKNSLIPGKEKGYIDNLVRQINISWERS